MSGEETIDGADDVRLFENPVEVLNSTPRRASGTAALVEDDAVEFASGVNFERRTPDVRHPWMEHHKFTLVQSVEELNAIVDRCIAAGECALDLETEGLDNRIRYDEKGKPHTVHKIVGFCLSYDGHEGFYVPVRHNPGEDFPDLNVRPVEAVEAAITRLCRAAIPEGTEEDKAVDRLSYKCERPAVVIYFWNAYFDHEFLYPVTGIDWWHPASFECGMLATFCLDSYDRAYGLKARAKALLRDPKGNPYTMIELPELFYGRKKSIRFASLVPDEPGVVRYACSDAICTFLLSKKILPECQQKHGMIYRLEKQTGCVVRVMERNEVLVDADKARDLYEAALAEKQALLDSIKEFARYQCGIELEPNSPKQLSEFLFGPRPRGMDISPKPDLKEGSTQYPTDAATLEELAQLPNAAPILRDIVRYRGADKMCGTYMKPLANNAGANGTLRFAFKQTGAASGRFSAPAGDPTHGFSGVPIHGIPNDQTRRCFVARPGYALVKADYSGEELRIAANVTGEKVWIDEFLHGTGDLHSITARAFFGKQQVTKAERGMGKTANFALLYGGGPQAVMRATGCDKAEARRRKDAFDRAVPTFASWCKRQHALVKKQKGVFTPFGRWVTIPNADSPDHKIRAACERYAINYVIQGGGADIMKIALVLLHKKFERLGWLRNGGDDSVRMLLTVHDEIVFEIKYERVAEAVQIIADIMESPWRLPKTPRWQVPLIVEPLIGYNWASGYKAERAKPGEPLKPTQVEVNGFVYSTTREALLGNDGAVVETPDRGEEVYGKVLRIVDPPWLPAGGLPPSTEGGDGGEKPAPEVKPRVLAAPISLPTPQAQAKASAQEVVEVMLVNLYPSAVDKVLQLIRETEDPVGGSYLHLKNGVEQPLISVADSIRVDAGNFLSLMRKENLTAS